MGFYQFGVLADAWQAGMLSEAYGLTARVLKNGDVSLHGTLDPITGEASFLRPGGLGTLRLFASAKTLSHLTDATAPKRPTTWRHCRWKASR